jgi:hypothetical protein
MNLGWQGSPEPSVKALDIEFGVPTKLLVSDLSLGGETYPPPPNDVFSRLQGGPEVVLKLSAGAELCTIRLLMLLDSGKHPGAAILSM